MKRMQLAALLFCLILLAVFFNYIYVRSVRSELLQQIDALCESFPASESSEQTMQAWKNRKRLLTLSVPLAVLDQIDIQFSSLQACIITQDQDTYLRTCHHLRELFNSLGR